MSNIIPLEDLQLEIIDIHGTLPQLYKALAEDFRDAHFGWFLELGTDETLENGVTLINLQARVIQRFTDQRELIPIDPITIRRTLVRLLTEKSAHSKKQHLKNTRQLLRRNGERIIDKRDAKGIVPLPPPKERKKTPKHSDHIVLTEINFVTGKVIFTGPCKHKFSANVPKEVLNIFQAITSIPLTYGDLIEKGSQIFDSVDFSVETYEEFMKVVKEYIFSEVEGLSNQVTIYNQLSFFFISEVSRAGR